MASTPFPPAIPIAQRSIHPQAIKIRAIFPVLLAESARPHVICRPFFQRLVLGSTGQAGQW